MSPTKSSTIKRARFLEWPRYIRGTISSLNERKRWIGGVLTLSGLFERLISQRTRNFQSRLQRKMIPQVTNAIQCYLSLNLGLLRPLFEANFAFRDVRFSASSGLNGTSRHGQEGPEAEMNDSAAN